MREGLVLEAVEAVEDFPLAFTEELAKAAGSGG